MSLIVLAYFFGGVINHALNLAIHEISHNLAFGHSQIWKNRALGIFANLPIGIPTSVTFKKYHLLHHRYQGDVELDMDIPTKLEARLFCTRMTKLIWLLLQPCTYSIRPLFGLPMSITLWELINAFFCLTFDYLVVALWGWKPLIYLFAGTLLTMGAHPVAGHFISEHFLLDKEHETYSYYGILNWVTFNVGYHVEHHDFPYIPGSRLPMLRKLAPEFYENWPHHTSWVKVLYNFVMRPDMGPFARICRKRSDVQQCSACGSSKN
ncbi:unnamed protein product [Dicrocoelium dendriticum]|nr:unnamed protein product [Dicrocoelium dendriticum]